MKTFHVFVVLCMLLGYSDSIESDLTIDIEAGKRECFHQYVEKGSTFDMEYQVIDGGDLDINFLVQSPSGRVMITEIKKVEGSHTLEAVEGGDFKFCLDNTFSRFSSKLVFFELLTDNSDPNWVKLEDLQKDEDVTELFEMKLEDFQDVLDLVKQRLDKTQQSQKILKAIEARDRSVQEENFQRVNFWSGLQLFAMISVGLVQVLMVRNLFDDKSASTTKMNIRT